MSPAPRSIGLARVIGWLQTVAAAAVAALSFLIAALAWDSDKRAHAGGFFNPFSGIGETVGIFIGCTALLVLLLIAVPVVRLRRPRDGTRVWLAMVEAAVALACGLITLTQHGGGQVLTWVFGVAPAIGAMVLLCRRSSREWTGSSSERLREVGQ